MSGVPQDDDKKRNDQSLHINLKVKGQVFFLIKRSTLLKKLMNAYCDRQSVELNSIAFLLDAVVCVGSRPLMSLKVRMGTR